MLDILRRNLRQLIRFYALFLAAAAPAMKKAIPPYASANIALDTSPPEGSAITLGI